MTITYHPTITEIDRRMHTSLLTVLALQRYIHTHTQCLHQDIDQTEMWFYVTFKHCWANQKLAICKTVVVQNAPPVITEAISAR